MLSVVATSSVAVHRADASLHSTMDDHETQQGQDAQRDGRGFRDRGRAEVVPDVVEVRDVDHPVGVGVAADE
jgi:hypothetical protein